MTDRILDWEFPAPWPYEGVVTNRVDPEGLHRIKFRIDGEVEPESDWCYPAGSAGAGGPDHGLSPVVPPLGATVLLVFVNGDRENPRYLPGHYGDGEVPQDSEVTNDGDNIVYRDKRLQLEFDSRADSYGVRIQDKATGLVKIDIDMAERQIDVEAVIGVSVTTTGTLTLRGGQVLLNNRPVMPAGPPI